jgi:hypothetical protein
LLYLTLLSFLPFSRGVNIGVYDRFLIISLAKSSKTLLIFVSSLAEVYKKGRLNLSANYLASF